MANTDGGRSRRSVLKAAAGLGASGLVAGLAGCSDLQEVVTGSGGSVGLVPEDAESVYTVDAAAVLEDDAVESLTTTYLELQAENEWYEGPEDYEETLERFEDETGLDATMADSLTAFSEYSDYGVVGSYSGTIFSGEWDEDDVVDAFEDGYDADEDEYEGTTIYVPPEPDYQQTMGILGDGQYVVGSTDAVEDVIDVQRGEEDSVDSELESAYSSTRSAPVRFAGEMASWAEQGEIERNGESVDTEPIGDVEFVSGAVYKSGESIGVETTMHAEDQETAEDVLDVIEGYIAVIENDQYTAEELKDELDELAVEQDGDTVVVTYEKAVDEIEDLMEDAAQ